MIWVWLYVFGIVPATAAFANLAAYDNKMPTRDKSIYFKGHTHPGVAALLGPLWPLVLSFEVFCMLTSKAIWPGEMLAERKLRPRLPPAKPQPAPEDLAEVELDLRVNSGFSKIV